MSNPWALRRLVKGYRQEKMGLLYIALDENAVVPLKIKHIIEQ